MKIARVEATWLQVPIPLGQQHTSDFGRASTFDTALVRIDTDVGKDLSRGDRMRDIGLAGHASLGVVRPLSDLEGSGELG